MRSRLARAPAVIVLLVATAAVSTVAAGPPAAATAGLAAAHGAPLGAYASPAWTVQASAHAAAVYSAQLGSISCVSSKWCMATGIIYGSTGTGTLAEKWNGKRWAVVPTANAITTPHTDPPSQNFLDGISCTSESFCITMGWAFSANSAKTFSEVWNGKRWSLRPLPPDQYAPMSYSVSCVSASYCIAVTQLTSVLWDGTNWTKIGGSAGNLGAVTCLSTTDCQAVGEGTNGESAELWNGKKWTVEKSPKNRGGLFDVTCFSPTDCIAVGTSNSLNGKPIASSWNGTAWGNVVPLPTPKSNQGAGVGSISCPSSHSCFAVGSYTLPGPTSKSAVLVDHWDGSKWTLGPSPAPTSVAESGFGTLDCTSGSWCMAVGTYGSSNGPQGLAPLAESWNGSKWSAPNAIDPSGDQDILSASACASATSCVAVGAIQGGFSSAPLAESWNGTAWKAEAVPVPKAATDGYLTGTSCPSPTMCVAVGSALTSSGSQIVLTDSWNGSKWSPMSTAAPHGGDSVLNSVTCLSWKSCTAVGTDSPAVGTQRPLIETWNGTSWSVAHSPTVAGTLNAVSCTSSTSCAAAGSTSSAYGVALIESWNGTTWTVEKVPAAAKGSIGVDLLGISCASALCVAVGQDETGKLISGPTGIPIAEVFNGASWSTNYPLGSSETADSLLAGVACSSAGSCEATGSLGLSSGADEALGERWNGASWQRQPMPAVPGSQSTSLLGVSCLSASACTAVGSYTVLPGSTGLVERYS